MNIVSVGEGNVLRLIAEGHEYLLQDSVMQLKSFKSQDYTYETALYKTEPKIKYSASRSNEQKKIVGRLYYKIRLFSNVQFHKPQLNMFRQVYLKCKNLDQSSVVMSLVYGNQIDQLFTLKDKETEYIITQLVRNAIFNINYLIQSICHIMSSIHELKSDTTKNLLMVLVKDVAKYIDLLDTKGIIPTNQELDFYCQR